MRHFNYFENGGPAPSACISCSAIKELFEIGQLQYGGMAQLCHRCVKELATFIGYVEAEPMQLQIDLLKNDIEAHELELAKVPDLVDGLINGIRSSVTDFIFAVSYSDNSSEPETVSSVEPADSGDDKGGEVTPGQRKAPSKSSSK